MLDPVFKCAEFSFEYPSIQTENNDPCRCKRCGHELNPCEALQIQNGYYHRYCYTETLIKGF